MRETLCVNDVTNSNFDCAASPASYSFIQWASLVCQRPNSGVGVFLSHDELSSLQMTHPSRQCVLNFKHHRLSGLQLWDFDYTKIITVFFWAETSSDSAGTAVIRGVKWLSLHSRGTRLDSQLHSFCVSKCPWARTPALTCVSVRDC